MYEYVKSMVVRGHLWREAPSLASSLAIAEVFYKFHSFVLECAAFLGTCIALSWLSRKLERTFAPRGFRGFWMVDD